MCIYSSYLRYISHIRLTYSNCYCNDICMYSKLHIILNPEVDKHTCGRSQYRWLKRSNNILLHSNFRPPLFLPTSWINRKPCRSCCNRNDALRCCLKKSHLTAMMCSVVEYLFVFSKSWKFSLSHVPWHAFNLDPLFQMSLSNSLEHSGVPRNFFRGGGFNKVSWGQRERGSRGSSPLVRGSGGSCNLVQEISFHIVKFS
jgi:hypothetical protein